MTVDASTSTRVTASWSGEDVRLADVVSQLDRLRRTGQRTFASRTAVVTLVVVARSDESAAAALDVVHRFGGRHPGRCVVLCPRPDEPGRRIDASVHLLQARSADHPVWFEDIQLVVRGDPAAHLAQLVEPLVLADLPLAVWFPDSIPRPRHSLLAAATGVVVDSRAAVSDEDGADPLAARSDLEAISGLFSSTAVVDLAWIRLRPWRELLAGLFDGPDFRPFAGAVTSVDVRGKPGARALLGGWVASRLKLDASVLHLADARHAALRLDAEVDGRRGTFVVERVEGERTVRSAATLEHGPHHTEVVALPELDLSWSLGRGLSHLTRDPVYEAAVRAVVRLPD